MPDMLFSYTSRPDEKPPLDNFHATYPPVGHISLLCLTYFSNGPKFLVAHGALHRRPKPTEITQQGAHVSIWRTRVLIDL